MNICENQHGKEPLEVICSENFENEIFINLVIFFDNWFGMQIFMASSLPSRLMNALSGFFTVLETRLNNLHLH